MSLAKLNNLCRARAFTCYLGRRLCSNARLDAAPADFASLRRRIQEDEISLDGLSFPQIKELSDQVSAGLRSQAIEKSLAEKYSNLVSEHIQRESPESRRFSLDDYFALLEYNYMSRSDKYISILTANINSLLEETYGQGGGIPGDVLERVVFLLSRLNKLGIYNSQLFDFAAKFVRQMDSRILSEFAALSQRYGLRTKHVLDACYKECLERADRLDLNQTLNLLRSFSFFSYEYRELFLRTAPKLVENVSALSKEDVLMALNVAKTLNKLPEMTQMRDAVLDSLIENLRVLPNQHLIRCVGELSRGPRSRKAKVFLSRVLEKVDEGDFRTLTINALVNLLHTINYYKMKMMHMTEVFKILGERMPEVVGNRNLGLWAEIFAIALDTGWFSLEFMQAAAKHIILEPQVLCRVSTYQLVRVLQTFYKLRLYHRESYQALLDSVEAGFDSLVPKFNMIAEAILAAADANVERPQLFSRTLEFMTGRVDALGLLGLAEELVPVMSANFIWPRNVVTSAWSFAVMDFHRGPEFAKLLRLLLHPRFHELDLDLNLVLMCLETAEACLVDGAHMALAEELADVYGDKMRFAELSREEPEELESLRDNRLSFTESQNVHFHKGRARATRHLQAILENLNKRDVLLRVAPHYNSPYIIDVCFSKENKKGIVLFSGRELLRSHIDGTWSVLDTGSSKLKLRVLRKQNWRVVQLSCSEWACLESGVERKEFVKRLLEELDISY